MKVHISVKNSKDASPAEDPKIKRLEAHGFQLNNIEFPEGSGSTQVTAELSRKRAEQDREADRTA